MMVDDLTLEVEQRKLDFLIEKLRVSSWTNFVFVLVVVYFLWDSAQKYYLVAWAALVFFMSLHAALFAFPRYDQQVASRDKNRYWSAWFISSVSIAGLVWILALWFFTDIHDPKTMLIRLYAFFVLIVASTVNHSSNHKVYLGFTMPLAIFISLSFLSSSVSLHNQIGLGVIFFIIFNILYVRISNRETTSLLTLQLEKQKLVDELELKTNIAETSVDEKNRFLAAASHDLRQPLHASGLLISLLGNHINNQQGKTLLDGLKSSNQALRNSFNSLMDISRLDAGVVEVDLQHFNLKDRITSIHKEFVITIEEKELELNVQMDDLIVESDYELLGRVIRNILSNAIKYTDTGSITISSSRQSTDGRALLEIKDTGIGIAADEQASIFSEYYQINNPERDREKGFGLGLAIVKRLCNLLEIDCSLSSLPNIGTEFSLKIPSGDPALVSSKRTSESLQLSLEHLSIVIVDDNVTVLSSMTALLESWGCEVLFAESGDEAVKKIEEIDFTPDLIIADFRLRDNETGADVFHKIFASLGQEIPTVIITGDTSPDRLLEVKHTGFQILHKPVPPGELRTFLQYTLKNEA